MLAKRKNITMILDALFLLSSWSGNLDFNEYNLTEHRSIIHPLQSAFTNVLDGTPAEHKHEW